MVRSAAGPVFSEVHTWIPLEQGSASEVPDAKPSLPVLVSKLSLEFGHGHLFNYFYDSLHATCQRWVVATQILRTAKLQISSRPLQKRCTNPCLRKWLRWEIRIICCFLGRTYMLCVSIVIKYAHTCSHTHTRTPPLSVWGWEELIKDIKAACLPLWLNGCQIGPQP